MTVTLLALVLGWTHTRQAGVASRLAAWTRDSAHNERVSEWKAPPGWRKLRLQVFARLGRACYRCGAYATTVDHAIPVALGGSHDLSNLRPACARCNSSTGASLGNRLKPRTPPWGRRGARVVRTPPPLRSSRDW